MKQWAYTLVMSLVILTTMLTLNGRIAPVVQVSAKNNAPTDTPTPTTSSGGTVTWTGNGQTNGQLDGTDCESGTNYLYWIFTTGGNSNVTAATLTLGGSGSGSYAMSATGNNWKVTTGYFSLSTLTAFVTYVGSLGNGNAVLTISHGCPGNTTPTPTPTTGPTATPTPTSAPSVTPTPTTDPCANNGCVTPTPTTTIVPTDTPTPNSGCTDNCGSSNNNSSNSGASSSPSQPTQAVLGASTMASTGTFETSLMNIMLVFGMMVLGAGSLSYAKEKNK